MGLPRFSSNKAFFFLLTVLTIAAVNADAGAMFSGITPTASFSVGINPYSVVTADANNDGNLDLVVSTDRSAPESARVMLGDGTGNFVTSTIISVTATGDHALAVDDFNLDGNADIVITSNFSKTFTVIKGDGAGWFIASNTYVGGMGPISVASADFNNDGKPDVALVSHGDPGGKFGCGGPCSGFTTIYLQDNLGGFAPVNRVWPSSMDFPRVAKTADLNNDGLRDLIILGDKLYAYLSQGTGAFSKSYASKAPNPVMTDLTTADYNNDGNQDVAVANYSANTVSVMIGGGLGGFVAEHTFPAGAAPSAVASADFNMDGLVDLAVANSASNNVWILLNRGGVQFVRAMVLPTGTKPVALAVGDFNSNGRPDLAVVNNGSATVSILLN